MSSRLSAEEIRRWASTILDECAILQRSRRIRRSPAHAVDNYGGVHRRGEPEVAALAEARHRSMVQAPAGGPIDSRSIRSMEVGTGNGLQHGRSSYVDTFCCTFWEQSPDLKGSS